MPALSEETLAASPCAVSSVSDSKNAVMHSKDFDRAIAEGRQLIVFEKKVYELTNWEDKHPGGAAVIRSYIGRDATNSMNVFHGNRKRVSLFLRRFYIAEFVADSEIDKANLRLTEAFEKFHEDLIDEGIFKTNKWNFVREISSVILSYIGIYYLLNHYAEHFWAVAVASFLMTVIWDRVGFLMHDSIHYAVTQQTFWDKVVTMIGTAFIHGNSYSWWVDQHRIHHANPNDVEEDVLVQLLPFIAVSPRLFKPIYSKFYEYHISFNALCKFFVAFQHILILPGMIISRVLLYKESFVYLHYKWRIGQFFTPPVLLEVFGILFYWTWYISFALLIPNTSYRIYFIVLPHLLIGVLHLQLNLSHSVNQLKRTGVWPLKEHFIGLQFRNTLDIDNVEWLDFFHGGLQFHVAHHLFPRAPRHSLRRLTGRVKEFAAEHNLEYVSLSFYGNIVHMLENLKEVAEIAKSKTLEQLLTENFYS